ncbi:13403_t:CDS:1, partial [Acaulospora morrowiae]
LEKEQQHLISKKLIEMTMVKKFHILLKYLEVYLHGIEGKLFLLCKLCVDKYAIKGEWSLLLKGCLFWHDIEHHGFL